MPPPREQVFGDLVLEMRAGLICPVLFGSAEEGHGVGRLLKALRHEAPGVGDLAKRLGFTPGAEAVVQVVKTVHTAHGGKLTLARVLAGEIRDGMLLVGPSGAADRVSASAHSSASRCVSATWRARATPSPSASSTTPAPATRSAQGAIRPRS